MNRLLVLLGLLAAVCSAQAQTRTFEWRPRGWTSCSGSCGGRGVQRRHIDCLQMPAGSRVAHSNCHGNRNIVEPRKTQVCGHVDCPVKVASKPGPCSKSCGRGVRLPLTTCTQLLANGTQRTLTNQQCEKHDSSAFSNLQVCNTQHCPPVYQFGAWGACSQTCGTGIQRRTITCTQERYGRRFNMAMRSCQVKYGRKKASKSCVNEHLCPDNYYWRPTQWSPCRVTCQRDRKVTCFSQKDHKFVDVSFCKNFAKPLEVERCINSGIYTWRVDAWGSCSKTCGGGARMRRVYCANAYNGHPAKSCPLCLKPKDQIECAQLPCPGDTAGAQGECSTARENVPVCTMILKYGDRYCKSLGRVARCCGCSKYF